MAARRWRESLATSGDGPARPWPCCAGQAQASNYAWLIAEAESGISTFDPTFFRIDRTFFLKPLNGDFSVVRGDTILGGDDTQIYVIDAAIPEPATVTLAAIGIAGLLAVGRKRRPPRPKFADRRPFRCRRVP